MFDLLIIALLQFATLNGTAPSNAIGAAGWENDIAPSTNTIGAAGWENDIVSPSNSSSNAIGAAGWEND